MINLVKKVDLRSRKSMLDYLNNHCKYYTMNSWNRVVNFAHNVKLHNLGLSGDLLNKAYEY